MTDGRTARCTLLRLLGVVLVALALLPSTASAAQAAGTWYVSADGDDGQDCSSPATACRTLAAALARASDGDTVEVAAGSYPGAWRPLQSVSVRGAGASATTVGPLAVWNRDTTVAIAGVTIAGGASSGGGGIENSGTVTLTDSVVRDNRAWAGEGYQAFGAGVFNLGTMTVLRSTIRDNQAQGFGGDPTTALGGGVHNRGTLTVTDSTISGNTGNVGAGIYNTGTLTLVNSTVSGNRARVDGGGAATTATGDTVLRHVTVTANTSDSDGDGTGDGGGIASTGRTETAGSVLAGNDDPGGQGPDCSGSVASRGTNLIGRPAGCTITGTTGTDLLGVDPRLAPLADDGAATATHEPLEGSPAIDAARGGECLPTDQRGTRRPQGGACDIGAVERLAPAPQTCPCSLWPGDPAPAVLEDPDRTPVELGVRFRSDVDGFITGVRFFKGPGNTGPHTGTLWSDRGQRLATGTFTDETASGWQELVFPTPVPVQAATTYVASYHTEVGRYAVDEGWFTGRTVRSGPLQALADGAEGSNGVYAYGPSSFPTRSYRASNYWVDVRFEPSVPLVASSTLFDPAASPAVLEDADRTPVELGVRFRSDVDGLVTGVRFFKGPGNTGPHTGTLWSGRGQRLATGTFTDETPTGWQELVFATPVPISARTTYVASYHTEVGRYAVDEGWFDDRPVRRGPLRALAGGGKRGNGVYAYGPSSFPTRSHRASNYWVDVRFTTTTPGSRTDLGTLGGTASTATSVNDAGVVVGATTTAPGQTLQGYGTRAFAWQRGGTMRDLGVLSTRNGGSSQALDVNERGQIVGDSLTDAGERHVVLWDADGITDLGTLGGGSSSATSINDAGDVVGSSTTASGEQHAFLWRNGRMTDLGTLGGRTSTAQSINDRGDVAGSSQRADERTHAVLWRQGTLIDLGGFAGGQPSVGTGVLSIAHALDDAGDVVGWSAAPGGSRAARWRGGAVLPLGTALAGVGSVATGIDDLGVVVGSAPVRGERHAVAWRDGSEIDLGTLGGAAGAVLAVAGGTVVGRSTTSAGQTRATVWTIGGAVRAP